MHNGNGGRASVENGGCASVENTAGRLRPGESEPSWGRVNASYG